MKMKNNILRYVSLLISIIFFLQSVPLYAATMEDYCLIPPYVKRDVDPNILIMMDNSQINGTAAYPVSTHATYDPTQTYPGYFRSDKNYVYVTNQWVPDPNGLSGNILNWATTSRFDLIQSILVGGKSRARQAANINTLAGYNSGTWGDKTYSYTVGATTYTCVFKVNVANKGALTITENNAGECGLLQLTPVYPLASSGTYRFASMEDSVKPEPKSNTLSSVLLGFANSIFDFLAPEAEAAKPLSMTKPNQDGINLTDVVQGEAYEYGCTASGGTGIYTWSATGLPSGLSMTSAGDITGMTNDPLGTYTVTITVDDGNTSITRTVYIDVALAAGGIQSIDYNVWVCAGDYSKNCTNAAMGEVLKVGIVQMFWDQAQFGFMDFSSQLNPSVQICIPANNDENYYTQIQNAVPVGDPNNITKLVDGEYEAIQCYRASATSIQNCDPFLNDTEPCRKNFILMLTAGEGADNPPNPNAGTPDVFSDTTHCGSLTYNLSKNSCYGYNNDLRPDLAGTINVSTYIVNAMGVNDHILAEAATAGDGLYYNVTDPATLRQYLIQAFQDILKRAAAGTAASVLASGEGSGANLIQAVFYPRKRFYNSATGIYDEITWIGRLTNFWYYVDPFFASSTPLEDTTTDNILNLSNDDVVKFRFDPGLEATVTDRYNFGSTTKNDTILFEYVNYIWETGVSLWNRDLSASPRTIYTTTGADGNGDGYPDRISFSAANASSLATYLQASDTTEAEKIIRYMHGYDKFCDGTSITCTQDADCSGVSCIVPYRTRTVSVDLNGDGDTLDTVDGISESPSKVWKLADILNSTPRISSWIQLNTYDSKYNDSTYKNFLGTSTYQNRGMVFAGGNDGMLHAFKLGTLEVDWTGQTGDQKARLTGTDIGKEMWAFIPKNALPYLKYTTDPGYCHVYTVDLSPYVFDASIGTIGSGDISNNTRPADASTWRTILIGGMRFGGACRNTGSSCTDCVKTPVSGLGYSSYFALDITDQNDPKLLWEFTDPDLGFATTGPAIARVGDTTKNGKWFTVIGSGPTGPISTTDQQFLGRSDQSLKLFILDLKTGSLLHTINTGISYGFAGSMLNITIDTELNYQDDALYIGYVKKAADGTWTDGGVGRLMIRENVSPSAWLFSKVIDGIGPVTSAVTRLQNNSKHIVWLYFGTGRYYYEQAATVDDQTNQRHLFGIKEPCFTSSNTLDGTCTTTVNFSNLTNVTSIGDVPTEDTANSAGFAGWYINLDLSGNYTYSEGDPPSSITKPYRSERIITDPLSTTSGLVFFTSYKPYDDVCAYGGKSFIWAVRYNTGGAPTAALMKGIGLLQVSTGSIEQISIASSFTDAGGRKTSAMEGVPPTAQGLSLLSPPPAVKKVIHMRER